MAKDKILYFRFMLVLLRKIAFPFSLIYGLVVFFRNRLFDIGFFSSKSYNTPTLCVGNLSVGGTGKTPMIEFLVKLLEGHKVAVLSRGYKRKSKGFVLATSESTMEDLGDEPYQLYKKFPNIVVAVDADRRNGIQNLETLANPDVILLDDAFQHRRVKPSFSILLTSHTHLFTNDWYLPTGNLRDSRREAKRADLIVVTKCPTGLSHKEKEKISKRINPQPHQKVIFSTLSYQKNITDGSGQIELNALMGKRFALVTGIASPEPLVAYLKGLELTFEHFAYGDHHYFSTNEIAEFANFDLILTTEKDYGRLAGKVENLYYLEVEHSFNAEDHSTLREAISAQI
ncbi:MAG: tetraacyldisaccharide 4'-kinase [Allomuricauda sp.]